MKYSYEWLKELSGTKMAAEKAAELLTMHSFELEGLEKIGAELEGVIIGQIIGIKKHPNADKLQLTRVDTGKEKLDIVCGASNIKAGDKVPVALRGAKLPNGLEIKEAEIRGERSQGMLCAKDELGLGEDHRGIYILDKKAKIGTALAAYLKKDDTIFEIKVLPDRSHDVLSHVGVARELAALAGKEMEYDFSNLRLPAKKSKNLKIKIQDKVLCPRYIGAVMEKIQIKESPVWMKARLEASGIKPINNVVDATNYVMLELGQPLHAFDAEKITVNNRYQIVVRRAKKEEKMTLLDDKAIALSENDLLITNGETPLALAGVMGGKDSGISDGTSTVVIEAANFNAANIRRERIRLGLRTESSDRYEKEIDPNLAEKAMARIIEILEHTADGQLEGLVDAYPKKIKSWKINLDLEYVNDLLGEKVPENESVKILSRLGFSVKRKKPKKLEVWVPTFRLDAKTQEDLIEEIGRVWGYEKISPRPLIEPVMAPPKNETLSFERYAKETLVGLGFDEMYNYSFYSNLDAQKCAISEKHLTIANPMNPDQELVRRSLLPNLLKNIKENGKHEGNLRIFEVGRTYSLKSGAVKEDRKLMMAEFLEKDNSADTFYDLKGAVEVFLRKAGGKNIAFDPETRAGWPAFSHPSRTAEIMADGQTLGVLGEISPLTLSKYKIFKRVAYCEMDIESLLGQAKKELFFEPLRKFPTVTRDISLASGPENTVAKILEFIKKAGGELVLDVSMFDVFQKDQKTSLAFRIEFGADRTLENKEVDAVMEKIISGLEKELKVEIRK